MTTSKIILNQTNNQTVIDFCKKIDSSLNSNVINRSLEVCLTWDNKLAVDFDANFQSIYTEYNEYL